MSGATVTQGPTMVNPDKLETVEELRAELHKANALVLRLSISAHDLNALLGGITQCLAPVITAHLAGEADGTKVALDELVARHVVQKGAPAGGMH